MSGGSYDYLYMHAPDSADAIAEALDHMCRRVAKDGAPAAVQVRLDAMKMRAIQLATELRAEEQLLRDVEWAHSFDIAPDGYFHHAERIEREGNA